MAFRKENKIKSNFSKITIGLASPEEILENRKRLTIVHTNLNVTVFSASVFSVRSRTMNAIAVNTSVFVIKVLSAIVAG